MIINLPYDLKDIATGEDSEVVAKGLYLCEVVKATPMEAKEGKAFQVAITFKILEAEKPENAAYVGAQFRDFIQPLTATVAWKMKQWMDSLYGRSVEGKKTDTEKWVGRKVAIRTMVDTYNNRESTKVDRYMPEAKFRKPSADSGADPMDPPPSITTNGTTASSKATPPPAADDDVAI